MKLHRLSGGSGYTTFGCMWKKGECFENSAFVCVNEAGKRVPVQSRVTAYWPDGSVKWTCHTADARLLGEGMELTLAKEGECDAEVLSTGCCEGKTGNVSKLALEEKSDSFVVNNGLFTVEIPKIGKQLIKEIIKKGKVAACNARPELILATPVLVEGDNGFVDKRYEGCIEEAVIEECGPLQCIVKYTGTHVNKNDDRKLQFIIRMKLSYNCEELQFTHTFIYDGDCNKDYLKGLGIAFDMKMEGEIYNRHVKFTVDNGVFHESAVTLVSWRPRVPAGLHAAQMRGEVLKPEGDDLVAMNKILEDIPFWNTYDFYQDRDSHFGITKKLKGEHLRTVECLDGYRSKGGLSFGSLAGSALVSIRDFWEKYPSGYTVTGLDEDMATCHIWLWSPTATPMDFRHYADRGYNQVCYEGYDYKGADPVGIACTNEITLRFEDSMIATDEELKTFTDNINDTTLYVGTPEFYHDMKAFGYWSLPKCDTEFEKKLEADMDAAFKFYEKEVDQRKWYGMFNYGDFMHTYDIDRHVWRYDVGGYAWDNTELVPTLWLWLYFMRTGRADVFKLAEKLTRHTSEVDVYHIGKYKGMGSRHNVFHWGCPCKEARIAMAGHHRFYYYLTGDRRLEDIFEELKDNEATFLNRDPLGDFYDKDKMVAPSHARSGPDWSSLCSNWMTQWERFNDTKYRDKINVGSDDIKAAPLKLVSGPDFEFYPDTVHLRYIGERTTGGTHLQICMGAPSIWMEMADLLEDEEWKKMIADYGRFYFLPKEQRLEESNGLIGNREFSLPMMASAMGAYGAKYLNDPVTAERVWKTLLDSQYKYCDPEGFKSHIVKDAGNCAELNEISFISTNHAAQFCLNVIMCLEFIRDMGLPE